MYRAICMLDVDDQLCTLCAVEPDERAAERPTDLKFQVE